MSTFNFEVLFIALTGYTPLPWQQRLYDEFIGGHYPDCDIPTGLGKTSVIAIYLIALAQAALNGNRSFPRRLVYVVDRRVVVDQASAEAEKITARAEENEIGEILRSLSAFAGSAIAVSTLRGQHADNGDWRRDAGQPAIIVGTVDMIGSRLLF